MRKTDEIRNWAKGKIGYRWVCTMSGRTTERVELDNVITYTGADIMANILAGRQEYVPQYMGFVFGDGAGSSDPTAPARTTTWDSLETMVISMTDSNIVVSPLSATPIITVDGDDALYAGNSAGFVANSGGGELAFPEGGSFGGPLVTSDKIYQALLITRLVSQTGVVTYLPFSQVSLDTGGGFPVKPSDGFELALDWNISFF